MTEMTRRQVVWLGLAGAVAWSCKATGGEPTPAADLVRVTLDVQGMH